MKIVWSVNFCLHVFSCNLTVFMTKAYVLNASELTLRWFHSQGVTLTCCFQESVPVVPVYQNMDLFMLGLFVFAIQCIVVTFCSVHLLCEHKLFNRVNFVPPAVATVRFLAHVSFSQKPLECTGSVCDSACMNLKYGSTNPSPSHWTVNVFRLTRIWTSACVLYRRVYNRTCELCRIA